MYREYKEQTQENESDGLTKPAYLIRHERQWGIVPKFRIEDRDLKPENFERRKTLVPFGKTPGSKNPYIK